MLRDIDRNTRKINYIPHEREYKTWISKLSPTEIKDIKTEIISRIQGDEVATASWIPGSDWRGTPFFPIYEKACNGNPEAAALCFGLIVWVTFMEHEDNWGFGRYKVNNVPIKGLTYFKIRVD